MGSNPTPARFVRHSALVTELAELAAIEPREARAIDHAQRVFAALGRDPGYPLTSAVRGSGLRGLRELRPRAGRSRFRVLFVGDENVLILLALAPEARRDPRGFRRAVQAAERRRTEMA